MTVSYAFAVSSVDTTTFLKLLGKWRGSFFKYVWAEYLIWITIYGLISAVFHTVIPRSWLKEAEEVRLKFDATLHDYIDLKFMLAFLVSCVIGRWNEILKNIGFIETCALSISTIIRGTDDTVRLARRSIIRYLVLSQVLVFRDISMRVRRRFPTMQSLIESGYLFENELQELNDIETNYNNYWLPINWANNVVWKMAQQKYIDAPVSTNNVLNNIRDFRVFLENLCKFDWVPIPIAYPQVVFLAVRVYFIVCLFSRQHFSMNDSIFQYFPLMTSFQFVFITGWMKVAEGLLNPLGEDDDDFEGVWLIEKNIHTGMQIVDGSHNHVPELNIDRFSEPKFGLPLNPIGTPNGLCGSVADVVIPQPELKSETLSIKSDSRNSIRASIRKRFGQMSQKMKLGRSISIPEHRLQRLPSPNGLQQVTEETEKNQNTAIPIDCSQPK